MTAEESPSRYGTFHKSDLSVGGLNLAVETENLIPKSSEKQAFSGPPMLQATELHSKVSLLQVYPASNIHADCWKPPPLFDVGFYFLGLWNAPQASDYALCIFVSVTAFRFVLFTGPFSARWTLIRRWLVCTAQLFLLRGFSIMCTILPNPDPYCVSTVTKGNIFRLALEVIIGAKVTCRDVLYSGHAVHFTLCALIWRDYLPMCPLWFLYCSEQSQFTRILAYLSAFGGYMIIICTHFHYTVDVWIAF